MPAQGTSMDERKKVLIVDDEPVTKELLAAILSRAGYEVIVAADGVAAVEIAASESPDLVIVDGLLPKMHGFLACKAIKESDDPPKVIVLTGVYTRPTYRREILNAYRADDVLTKPFNKPDLLACVEKLLDDLAPTLSIAQPAPALSSNHDCENDFAVMERDLFRKR